MIETCPFEAKRAGDALASVPSYDVDFYGDAFIRDPYPHYARMRQLGPVVALPRTGTFAVTRHAEVREVLRDWKTYVSGEGVGGDEEACRFARHNTLQSDPPLHDIMRSKIIGPLLPGALEEIRPRVQRTADELIESLLDLDGFDGMNDFARTLPLAIVRDLVGLPEDGRENMLAWASASFDLLGAYNERGRRAGEIVLAMRDWIANCTGAEHLRPGSWTARIREMEKRGEVPPEIAPQLVLAYIPPSLDTTISATGELLFQLATNPAQWNRLRRDPTLIGSAVQEAIRLASPIRSFTRKVARNTVLAETPIPAGARLALIFASANRDERHFAEPDRFLVDRNPHDHVSFGHGIHMCAGMHLARLEMECLLSAMLPRVSRVTVGEPTIAINNTIRAFESLPARFERATDGLGRLPRQARAAVRADQLIDVVVEARREEVPGVASFVLRPKNGNLLPAVEPGAHIDVELSPGLIRQYSLCGDSDDRTRYKLAIKLEPESRGGSHHAHFGLTVGATLRISKPRNLFRLDETASHSILFAAGIGITPILSMARRLAAQEKSFDLHYSAPSRERAALLNEVTEIAGDRLHVHFSSEARSGRLDTRVALRGVPQSVKIYICGPTSFISAISAEAERLGWPANGIFVERFRGDEVTGGESFTLVAARSKRRLQVPANRTALEVLEEAGIAIQSSCRTGVCATCLTRVLEGVPDHRDLVQTDTERMTNAQMAVCCSRALTAEIVLDL